MGGTVNGSIQGLARPADDAGGEDTGPGIDKTARSDGACPLTGPTSIAKGEEGKDEDRHAPDGRVSPADRSEAIGL